MQKLQRTNHEIQVPNKVVDKMEFISETIGEHIETVHKYEKQLKVHNQIREQFVDTATNLNNNW